MKNYVYITPNSKILEALKLMDENKTKLLIVAQENKYIGLLSIGDIQRALIKNFELIDKISSIMRKDYIVFTPNDSIDKIKTKMLEIRAEFMPIVDQNNNIVKIYYWEELFGIINKRPSYEFDLPVIVMAGGLGTRLRPLTYVLPKPLIPINNKTLIEEIFERFHNHGCDTFHISVNYKAEFIEYYLRNQNLPFNLNFFKEDKPMGTAGSLSLLKDKINSTFFVTNCDILIDQDYSEVLKYHKDNKNEITIIASLKHYPIAYGTIESGDNGILEKLIEKPEITFKINSGMYILEPHLLKEIPTDNLFHITHLIENVKQRKGRVGVFPISEKSWIDIGTLSEYMTIIKKYEE
jgi:dTDP-glucose pyrophosphorylase/CBS domain-containing protein